MNKFLGIVLSAVVLICSAVPVSASEAPDIIITHPLALEEPSKDLNITTTSARVSYGYINDMNSWAGLDITYGAVCTLNVTSTDKDPFVTLILENSNGVLFEESGVITLRMLACAEEMSMSVYRNTGVVDEFEYNPADFNNYEVDLKIDNYDYDVFRIAIHLAGAPSSVGYLSTSIQYGFKVAQKSLIDIVSDWFSSFFAKSKISLREAFDDLFTKLDFKHHLSASKDNVSDSEESLLGAAGSVNDINFEVDILEDASLIAAFGFISPILSGLFANIKWSVLFNVSCTLLIASIVLGFVRHWKGD